MKEGHYVAPLDFDCGDGPLDNFIDLPLTGGISADQEGLADMQEHPANWPSTSFGLIIRKEA